VGNLTVQLVHDFFSWAWERHYNILIWYIRPLFLVPFCYFAYKRSIWGIVLTLIALATSMFWFPKPETVSPQVKEFLEAEIEWLFDEWTLSKILMTLLIPLTFVMLGAAFWKRSLLFGLSVVVFMAVVKVTWSIYTGGESGYSVLGPAIVGLIICVGLIYVGFRRLERHRTG
jgi:hypothetical protein